MARKVFQSDDLTRIIYGYGDPKHREQMQRIRQEIKDVILSKVPKTYPYQCMATRYWMQKRLEHFFQLKRCQCCSRHSHNKPNLKIETRYNHPWLIVDDRNVFVPECKNLGDCDCDCRREIRVLCRLIRFRSHMHAYLE